jgi:RNA polymerase sigma-70 factor (ECF subfamily)
VAEARRTLDVDHAVHARLVGAFVRAASSGDLASLTALLADDAVLVADAGPDGGRFGRTREIGGPLAGAAKVAAFVAAVGPSGGAGLAWVERELNGLPAVVVLRDGVPTSVIQVAADGARITGVFIQADPARVRRLAAARA